MLVALMAYFECWSFVPLIVLAPSHCLAGGLYIRCNATSIKTAFKKPGRELLSYLINSWTTIVEATLHLTKD